MKAAYTRRYRRRTPTAREAATYKKDNQHEHAFFAAPSKESFFKPNAAIQRKCAHCEAEDKQVSRMSDGNDEEKKIQKMDEDKAVQKMEDKKEEKPVMKMEDKKEDKEIHKIEDKKKEKPVMKMDDKKEDKEVHKMSEKEEEKKVSKKSNIPESNAPRSSAYIHSLDEKGNALPNNAKQFFNQRMGYDFTDVKIHTGSEAEQSAKDMNAKAYAVDHNIVFNKGQYNPGTAEGDKLLAHELAHIVQNKKARKISRKEQNPEKEKEKNISISGTSSNSVEKIAFGQCEGVSVQGRTHFKPLPSTFKIEATSEPSTECDCSGKDKCIVSTGTVISTFRSKIKVTLPPVPSGLTRCEAKAVKTFINSTLSDHEQQHVAAFSTYNGTVITPFTYTGCTSGLKAYVKEIHKSIDAERSTGAIAESDSLDPFVTMIPCNCE